MRFSKMKNKIFLLLFSLPLLAGCVHQEERARRRLESTCRTLMECTEEEVALRLGAPQSIQNIGNLKVYKYHQSYGTCKTSCASSSFYDAFSGTREEKSWETYDNIEVFFKNGYVINWKCSVKR